MQQNVLHWSYFGFLFTAPYYLVGLLLCLLGCSVLCRYRKWWAYVLGVVLLALSTGTYQAFIPTALCVMLLHFLRKLTLAENWGWKDLVKDILWYVSACLAFLALYSLMSKLCLAVTHETMTSYKGLDDPFAGGIGMFVQRIKLAYYLFLIPRGSTRSAYMFPYRLHTLYYIFLVVLCVAALLYLEQLWKRSRVRALSGLLALGVLPMALNFAHVMLPIHMEQDDIDYLCVAAHKGLYAPMGTGLLLCNHPVTPLLHGGTGSLSKLQTMPDMLPDRLESGTHNMPGIAGLLEGIRYVQRTGVETIAAHERRLTAQAVELLRHTEGIRLFWCEGFRHQTGVLSFVVEGMDCEELGEAMARQGVALRAGLHCAPLAHRTVGTLKTGTVRFSPSAFNTSAQVVQFAQILQNTLRKM